MTRIGERVRAPAPRGGARRFVAFVTAGDPSLDRTVEVALALEEAGVDVLELGVPFSDPLADGPVIQRASERALRAGTTLARVLEAVRAHPRAVRAAAAALQLLQPAAPLRPRPAGRATPPRPGVDGVLVTDLPPEEAGEWLGVRARGRARHRLPGRAHQPRRRGCAAWPTASRGFVYAVSRTGVTGERDALSDDARPLRRPAARRSPTSRWPSASASPRRSRCARRPRWRTGWWWAARSCASWRSSPAGDVAGQVRWLKSGM